MLSQTCQTLDASSVRDLLETCIGSSVVSSPSGHSTLASDRQVSLIKAWSNTGFCVKTSHVDIVQPPCGTGLGKGRRSRLWTTAKVMGRRRA
ncbi:hypothetical protein PoB_002318900 [Plakobranchus ocellatus]|uniref:Uncharacterized protein n=1 Tax=Plakobranchus ocellatus TaxID=259542 RepID=A0AAV3ZS35_9GAST|nr:hypothetical protein PoB_002318900 [Plakobranchus ocellatus]